MKKGLSVPLLGVFLLLAGRRSFANPVGATVQAGSASISQKAAGSLTINQASDKVIIDWRSFSIGAGEVTRFIQPNASSAALNRVLGGNPTEIYGLLQGNGQVFVINPAGILVGRSGVINTHSFAGSTLDVNDKSFLSGGGLRFSGSSTASVRNEGAIQALGGDIFLFAHNVENTGSLSAPGGTVGLGAGSEIVLSQKGNERVGIIAGNITAPVTAKGVNNEGAIQAASAELKAAGGNIYALAINNGGIVRATTVVNEGGRIYLRAAGGNIKNSGTLAASGSAGKGGAVVVDGGHNATAPSTVINSGTIEARGNAAGSKGGDVQVLGDHVGLFDHALVDVSGQAGGGAALIGGDFHGATPGIQNAEATFVGPGARVVADALSFGSGGNVAVWSDIITRFYGSISAQGGALGGNGGFVETSGKSTLDVFGASVNGGAKHGSAGKWLLDPTVINVVASDPGDGSFTSNLNDVNAFADPDLNAVLKISSIDVGSINNANSTVNLQAEDSISFNTAVNMTKGGSGLTARAGGSIFVNNSITTRGGDVTLSAHDPGALAPKANAVISVGAAISTDGSGQSGGAITLNLNGGTGTINLGAALTTGGGAGGTIDIKSTAALGVPLTFASAGGDITFESSLNGGNALTLNAGSGTITLNAVGATTPLTDLTASGGTVTLNGAIHLSGNLSLTANNPITDGGVVTVAGTTTLAAGAGNSITFSQADDFGGVVTIASGKDVTLNDINSLTLGASTVSGNLTVSANGAVSDSGAVAVIGTTSLAAGAGNNITFRQADNFGGAVSIVSGKDVTLNGVNALALGASTVSGKLTVTASGAITDSGAVTVAGGASLTAGSGNNITLDNADDFTGPVNIVSGKDVTLVDGNAIELGASTISGKLDVAAGGAISQSGGLLSVGGTSKFTVTAANSDVLLGGFANVFDGGVTLAVAGAGTIHDVALRDASASPTLIGLPIALNNLTLRYDQAGIAIPESALTGNLDVTANGPISDGGFLTVNGTTTLNAGSGNNITLTQNDNFNGALSVVSGHDVTILTDGALNLGASSISGKLDVTVGDGVSQSGLLSVSGSSKFTVKGGGSDILLADFANLFNGGVTLATTGAGGFNDVAIRDTSVTPSLNGLPASLHNLTLQYDSAGITLPAVGVTGNLAVTANGAISDSGDVTVNGTTTMAAGAGNNITFSHADDFVGGVSIVSGKDVSLNVINGLALGASTISGKLTVTANGVISDSGVVIVGGATSLAAGAANNIDFSKADDFGGAVSIVSGKDVKLNDVNGLTLGASTISGKLTVTANGLVSDSGAVAVADATSLTAGSANNISFSQADDFAGPVSIVSAKDVTLNDINGLTLGASTVSGNLNVTAAGLISDSAVLSVSGTTTLAAGSGNDITLSQANDFGGTVSIVSGKDVTLVDANAINLGASTVSGKLDVTAGGSISESGLLNVGGASRFTVSAAASDVLLGGFANLFNGGVTLAVAGAGTLHDVALRDASASPTLIGLPVALNNLTLHYDQAGIAIPAAALTGNLDVTANGPISDSGLLTVNGTTTLNAGSGNNITLTQNDNFGGAVSVVSGHDVTILTDGALNLGASSISGKLDVTVGDGVSQSGLLTISGSGKFTVKGGGSDILLADFANLFNGGVILATTAEGSFNNVAIRDASVAPSLTGLPATLNNLTLHYDNAGISLPAATLTGNLDVTANGAISQAGPLIVNGVGKTASFNSIGNNITLNDANNDFAAVSLNGAAVSITDINDLKLGASTVNGNLSVTANGLISDSGNLVVGGVTTLAAGAANNITFSQAEDFGGAVSIVSGKDVTLVDVNAINLGASTVSGKLDVTAGGSISESSALSVGGASKFTVSVAGSDLILAGFPNLFNGGVTLAVAGAGTLHDVALRDAAAAPTLVGLPAALNNLTLRYDNAGIALPAETLTGNLDVSANGPITDSGAVVVSGTTTLAAGAGNNITLSQADDFGGTVNVVSGKDVTLVDVNAINLGASTVSGKLDVTAGGSISESGLLNVGGASKFTVSAVNSDVLLGGFANLFNGGATLAVAGAGTLHDVAIRDASPTPALFGLPSALNNLTLRYDNAGIALPTETLTGNLDVAANGPITDSGNVVVAGTTSLTAGTGNNITFSQADDFGGAVTVVSGHDVNLADINAINLGASTISGKLDVTAVGGISQSGLLNVGGSSRFTVGAAASDISLGNFANLFGGGVILGAVGAGTIHDVALRDASTTPLLTGLPGTLNNLTLHYDNAGIVLPVAVLTGNLDVTANGAISQAGPLTVNGAGKTASFNSTGNSIALSDPNNDFATASFNGVNVSVDDKNGLILGASTINGNLSVIANGPLTDSGIVKVVGTTSLATGAANDITLSQVNDFGGVVSIISGKDVTLADLNAINLGASTVSGKLDITAGGSISESGVLTVGGASKFSVSAAGSDILLAGFPNLFNGGVTLAVAGAGTLHDVALRDASAAPTLVGLPAALNNLTLRYDNAGIALPAETLTGNLDVSANGPISDSGNVVVAGTTTLAAGSANNITLNQADDFGGSVSVVSGKDVTLVDVNTVTLGASTVSGKLDVTAGGSISESGVMTVSGASKFAVSVANSDVLLGGFANLFNGGVTLAVAGAGTLHDVALRDASATPLLIGLPAALNNLTLRYDNAGIALPTETLTGNLDVASKGPITDSGSVVVAGTTTLTAGSGNNITFSQADDFGGAVTIVSGKDVTLNDVNSLTLAASTITGNLRVTANGQITDSGNLTVAGATLLAAGPANNITLDNADDFAGLVSILSGKDVIVNDINSLALGASSISGNLTVTANGALTDNGNVVVGGATTLAVGAANNITLDNADDFIGPVSIANAKDVSLTDINALTLGPSAVGGNLVVTANGAITDSGNVIVSGTTSLAAGPANNITLNHADDFGGTVSVLSGKDVTLVGVNKINLGASTVSGALDVTAGGSIAQSGALTVGGASKFTVSAAATDILLGGFPNVFDGGVTLAVAGAGTLHDVALRDASAAPSLIGLPASLNNLTLHYDNAGIALPSETLTGNLDVTANGPISDSGNVVVSGTTTLTAGTANNITLTHADDFSGAVTIVSGKDVTLNDVNSLTLAASTISGNLTLTANGLISDSGNLTVAGATTLAAGAANNIILDNPDDFVGPVGALSAKDVTLNDVNALALGASTISGNLTVTAKGLVSDSGSVTVAGATSLAAGAGNNITLDNADDFVGAVSIVSGKDVTLTDINALSLGASTVSGNLAVTANGLVSDSGNLNVAGTTSLGAGTANNITLDNPDDFVGAISIVSGKDVTLNDVNALILGASTVSGNLTITANGLISDSGNITVSGTTGLAAGTANSITFTRADDFVGPVSIVSGKDVTLTDVNSLTLGASTVSGNLAVTANGLVSDSGNMTVAGTTSLGAGVANNITLDNGDDFVGAVNIVSGKDVTLNDVNALTLGVSTVSGNIKVTANGLVSDNGNVTVAGTTSLGAGAANNITLDNADDFVGAVSVVSGKDVTLNDVNALTLGISTVSGNLHVTANGLVSDNGNVTVAGTTTLAAGTANNITLENADDFVGAVSIVSGKDVILNDVNGLTLGASTISGNLTATANGLLSDSGNLTVAGTTALRAGTANNITLKKADDFVGAVSIVSAKDVTLNDVNALTLGASTVSGNLTISANGLVSDSGNVTVAGTTSLAAGVANNITLNNADDFIGAVSIVRGKDVTLNDVNALTLGASSVSGNLTVTANGLVSDSGNVTVAGTTSLAAGAANNITLDNADDFAGPLSITSGKDVTLNDVNALTLGASTVSGNLTVTANGLVSDSGNVTAAGTISLAAGTGNNITLDNANDFIGAVSIVSGKDVTLNDVNALTLGVSTVSGNLTVTANGLVSDSGNVLVAGATSLAAGTGNITLDNADDFVGPVSVASGKDVTLNDVNALSLGASAVSGNLTVTANGLVSDSGDVTVAGATSLSAGTANNITLTHADDFAGPVSIISGNDVTLNDVNALTLGASTVSGNLSITANGLVSDSAALMVAGTTSIAAGFANNITFSQGDDFVGPISIISANAVSLNDINSLTLGPSAVGGNLTITANGLISDSGNVLVGGATSLSAGPANGIILSHSDDFVGPVSIVSGKDVAINDINALSLGASTVSGNLSITANGLISDSGNVTVAGTTSLAAGTGNNIALALADDFVGAVSIVSGKDVTLNDVNALTLGDSIVSGNLTLTANGDVSDSANVTVAGATSVSAGTANNVTFSHADDFVGPVSIVSGNNVSLNDVNALTLGDSTVSGNLNVTANGLIKDSGNVSVAGNTTLAAGAANNITLSHGNDFVGTLTVVNGNDVTLNDVNSLTLGASTVSGNLAVTAGGPISQNGALSVNGSGKIASFTALGNTIVLSDPNNDFGTVQFKGGDAVVNDANALDFGASTLTGNLTVTASGPITQSGAIVDSSGNTASFNAPGRSITLSNPNNNFATVQFVGSDVTVNDASALDIGVSTVTGNLTVSSGGPISQSGTIVANTAGAIASFRAPGKGITLDNANNDFATAKFVGGDVAANDVNTLDLGQSDVSGNLSITTKGAITQSGVLNVKAAGKMATLTAGSGNDVTLSLANDFAAVSVPFARDVTLRDINGFTLSAVNASGTLDLNTSAGDITQALDGTAVKAKNLTGVVKGALVLGNPANVAQDPGNQFVSAPQPPNEIGSIGPLSHHGLLYVFNSRTTPYGDATHPGEIANPVLLLDPTAVLGLKVVGPVSGQGLTVIRTFGDLVLMGGGPGGVVSTTEGDIELSAEATTTASGNFHNLAGAIAADGSPVPNTVNGSLAVQPGTDYLNLKPGSVASRYLVFSTDTKLNYGNSITDGKLSLNGLGADFVADQISFTDHRSPIIKQNGQVDDGIGNGFVFVDKQALVQTDETAKFFFDLLTVAVVNSVDATAEVDKLPPERPPTIWTSSYHLYLEEQKKKKKKDVVAHRPTIMALNLAGD